MGFIVNYCEERLLFVGRCNLYPLYEATGETAEEAMIAIMRLVDGLDLDNEPTDVDPSIELDETVEITNTSWPPFEELL